MLPITIITPYVSVGYVKITVVMNDQLYDEVSLERRIYEEFKLDTKIQSIIVRQIPAGRSAVATVFLSEKHQLYCFIDSPMRLTLRDARKIVSRMGLKALKYLPPHDDEAYFDTVARDKFNAMFPGRMVVTNEDLFYYKTMAPYCPALVQIGEVTCGVIKQYDPTAVGSWRPSVKFSYRRLQTS